MVDDKEIIDHLAAVEAKLKTQRAILDRLDPIDHGRADFGRLSDGLPLAKVRQKSIPGLRFENSFARRQTV